MSWAIYSTLFDGFKPLEVTKYSYGVWLGLFPVRSCRPLGRADLTELHRISLVLNGARDSMTQRVTGCVGALLYRVQLLHKCPGEVNQDRFNCLCRIGKKWDCEKGGQLSGAPDVPRQIHQEEVPMG